MFFVQGVGCLGDLQGVQVIAQVAVLVCCALVAPATCDLAAVDARGDEILGLTASLHFQVVVVTGYLASFLHVRAGVESGEGKV